MKVLLDHNIPAQLKSLLADHETFTARELSWDALENGDLLAAAQAAGFDVMVTGDQSLVYQQNNSRRSIGLVILTRTKRRLLETHYGIIIQALDRVRPGSYESVTIPNERPGMRTVK